MRTTLNLDDDVAAELDRLRRKQGLGMSEALNRLARAGIVKSANRRRYRNHAHDLGAKIDVTNVAEVLDLLDET